MEDGSLKIYNVTRSDAGLYTCIATNQFGVAKSTGSLIIKGILLSLFVLDGHWRHVCIPDLYCSQPCIILHM